MVMCVCLCLCVCEFVWACVCVCVCVYSDEYLLAGMAPFMRAPVISDEHVVESALRNQGFQVLILKSQLYSHFSTGGSLHYEEKDVRG